MPYYPSEKAYEVFSSGRLTAPLYKLPDDQGGWTYRFEICEMDPEDGAVPALLRPEELPGLRRLLRLVAFTIADDGWVSPEVREKLASLARDLDDTPVSLVWPLRPRDPVWKALRHVVNYLWEDEVRDFAATPSNGHIYRRLVALDRWLEGCGPPENLEVTDIDRPKEDDRFGLCPICGRHDGYLNVRRAQWFVCHVHHLRWCAGENLFSTWRQETPDDWSKAWKRISGYREVVPLCVPPRQSETEPAVNHPEPAGPHAPTRELPRLSPAVVSVLLRILQICNATEEQHFEAYPFSQHTYRDLVLIDRWLEGVVSPEEAVLPDVDMDEIPDAGGCPLCAKHDGYVNLGCYHWFMCHTHQTRWCLGHGVLAAEEYEDEITFRENRELIRQYRTVQPLRRPSRHVVGPRSSATHPVECPQETVSTEP